MRSRPGLADRPRPRQRSPLRGAGRSPVAAGTGARPGPVRARSGAPQRSRRELGQPPAGTHLRPVRQRVRGRARGRDIHLGGNAGAGPVGARQQRACDPIARCVGGNPAVHPRAANVVPALPAQPACRPRADGRPAALVHPEPACPGRTPCRHAPGARSGRPVRGRCRPTTHSDQAPASVFAELGTGTAARILAGRADPPAHRARCPAA